MNMPPLQPYRLQVAVVESRRRDGKVRQEVVAHLGAIDGYLLPGFFDGLDEDTVTRLKGEDWALASVTARHELHAAVATRMIRQLSNRLNPTAINCLLDQLRARIPPLTPQEDADLRKHAAQVERIRWGVMRANTRHTVEEGEEQIKMVSRKIEKAKALAPTLERFEKGAVEKLANPPALGTVPTLTELGFSADDLAYATLMASVSEERFDGVLDALVERKSRRVNKRTQTKRDLADLNATLNDLE